MSTERNTRIITISAVCLKEQPLLANKYTTPQEKWRQELSLLYSICRGQFAFRYYELETRKANPRVKR